MEGNESTSRRTALSIRVREIGQLLRTLSFEPNVWNEALAGLQSAFDAVLAVKYLPESTLDGWRFDSMEVAGAPGMGAETFRDRVQSALATHFPRSTFFDALTPEPPQRDRALLLSDITQLTHRPMGAMREYMSHLGVGAWDQLRVLVCDGGRLLSWVGLYSQQSFTEAERAALQDLVPDLKARLRFDQLAQHSALATASLEATMSLLPVPCFLLHTSGRILDTNESGRMLSAREPELMQQLGVAMHQRDARFQVHPIRVCGVTASYLATLRAPASPTPLHAAERARQWGLTKRQTTVLACLVEGLANKEIAARLSIALGTVELHVTAILAKAGVESRGALVAAYWKG